MSNIIIFKKKYDPSPRFLSQTQQYWDELENKRMLMDAVMENAAEELQNRGYDPDSFILDKHTMYEFLGSPLRNNEYEEWLGLFAFLRTDIIYMRTYVIIDPGNAHMAFRLFKLPDYERGNRAWLVYDQDKWKKGPGRDYFDLEELLEQKPEER